MIRRPTAKGTGRGALPPLVFRCFACGLGWEEAPAFFPVPDEAVDGERAWLCLTCLAQRAGAADRP